LIARWLPPSQLSQLSTLRWCGPSYPPCT